MDHSQGQHSHHASHHHHSNELQNTTIASRSDHHAMMQMSFHTGFLETILFEPWTTTSISSFIGSWIFIFILGILYEGIRELRQYLEEERLSNRSITIENANDTELEHMNTESPEPVSPVKRKIPPRYSEYTLHSILYSTQLTLSYALMLIAMTFNVYLFLAIILGVGTGHLLYTWTRVVRSSSTNHRHK